MFERYLEKAQEAGRQAVRENPAQSWFPCGFAWVEVPGNTSFGRWLKKTGNGRKGYPKGIHIWISEHGQSYTDKMTHASAMAESLAVQLQSSEIIASGRLD